MFVQNVEEKQCVPHYTYPMKTEKQAFHLLKSARLMNGKKCFLRHIKIDKFEK